MGSLRQRGKVLEAVSMVMLEAGKVLSRHEYENLGKSVPVRPGIVLNFFGSWSRLLSIMENTLPEVWAEIKEKETPTPKPPPPKPATPVSPAPGKPTAKTAVKEGVNGKNI
tara:strand:- start:3152 stop:3484 length:333 start_codon:yes stop_codon:yes gene_type:complete